MERAGVIRTLAEPNLTAISGESANFLAGGEFPIPAGFTCDRHGRRRRNCQYQIQCKKFGVGLNFLPVVLSEGRISLKVMTEVSELSTDNQLTLVQSLGALAESTTLTIPSIKTRRAETTVEIPSGGSLAMAGMIQEQTKQQINGIPGLMQLPILGALFKSRDYINRQTELMVIVTPYIVRAVAQKELSRPDDGYADASDPAGVLLGKFNRIYGVPGKVEPEGQLSGQLRLHSRLTDRARRRSMNLSHRAGAIAGRRRPAPAASMARAVALAGCAVMLAGCYTTQSRCRAASPTTTASAIRSRSRRASARSSCSSAASAADLSPDQRADVLAFANSLAARGDRRHRHRRAGRHAQRDRRRQRGARGPRDPLGRRRSAAGVEVRPYRPADPGKLATVRLNYPTMTAEAGPCGLWPHDLGPTSDREHNENVPYWNLGCCVAAQSRRHGRQHGRPGAAARRDPALYRPPHHRARQVPPRRKHGDGLPGRRERQDQRRGQMITNAHNRS